jgi:hypothetical protein
VADPPPWSLFFSDISDAGKMPWLLFSLKNHALFSRLGFAYVQIDGPAITTEPQIILSSMIMHPNIHQGINMYNCPHLVVVRAYHEDCFFYDNFEDNELPSVKVSDKSPDKKAISKVNKKMQIPWKIPFPRIAFMLIKPFTITAGFFDPL